MQGGWSTINSFYFPSAIGIFSSQCICVNLFFFSYSNLIYLTSLTPEQDRDLVVVVAALRSGGVTLSAKRDVLECIGMRARMKRKEEG